MSEPDKISITSTHLMRKPSQKPSIISFNSFLTTTVAWVNILAQMTLLKVNDFWPFGLHLTNYTKSESIGIFHRPCQPPVAAPCQSKPWSITCISTVDSQSLVSPLHSYWFFQTLHWLRLPGKWRVPSSIDSWDSTPWCWCWMLQCKHTVSAWWSHPFLCFWLKPGRGI